MSLVARHTGPLCGVDNTTKQQNHHQPHTPHILLPCNLHSSPPIATHPSSPDPLTLLLHRNVSRRVDPRQVWQAAFARARSSPGFSRYLCWLRLRIICFWSVVGYEPAGNASISTTTRATLMLSIIHGTTAVRYCSVML
jgi:hypothetical protein